jgi:hypothetical protein
MLCSSTLGFKVFTVPICAGGVVVSSVGHLLQGYRHLLILATCESTASSLLVIMSCCLRSLSVVTERS